MLSIEVSTPSPEPSRPPTLADLSRNASVISSSSSSGSTSSLLLNTPRPRPIRTFSSPRSRSRESPPTPRSSRPPAYLTRELSVYGENPQDYETNLKKRAASRSKSRTKSRNSSAGLRLQADDFEFGEILGEGAYSTVMHAVYPPTDQEYAIKVLDKGHLKRYEKLQTALAEKNILVRLGSGHPGIVRLHWAFHDEWSLYFVLDLAKNGELQSRISKLGSLSLPCAKYYAAQIVDAVAYMHSKDVIHRDLKPENLLLDDAMRIKITDFGTGKTLDPGVESAGTFVGTAQYIAPELLFSNTTYKSSDLWAVGCIIYQMIAGRFPFHALSEYLTWQKIKNLEYAFPDGFDEDAKDLVQKLLVLNPSDRLGAGESGASNDVRALYSHPFFKDIDWSTLWKDSAPPMESGLVKRERPLTNEHSWADFGAAWDDVVNHIGVGKEGDELDHLSDGTDEYADELEEGESQGQYCFPESRHREHTAQEQQPPLHRLNGDPTLWEPGPLDIAPMHSPLPSQGAYALNGALTNKEATRERLGILRADAIDVPLRTLTPTGSTTSSSEGSPVERLGVAMEALTMTRGRDRVTTPIQLTIPPDAQWSTVLQPDETLRFHSDIEVSSRARRLTATLLPRALPVAPKKLKRRHLILTDTRLVCVSLKHRQGIVVKSEVLFRSSFTKEKGREREKVKEKEKEKKDMRVIVVDVAPSGERGFIVLTSGKSESFISGHPSLAARWLKEIRAALDSSDSEAESRPSSRSVSQERKRP